MADLTDGEQVVDDVEVPASARGRLVHLDRLHALGLVTDDEYQQRRVVIVDRARAAQARSAVPQRRVLRRVLWCAGAVVVSLALAAGIAVGIAFIGHGVNDVACVDALTTELNDVPHADVLQVRLAVERQRGRGCDLDELTAAERARLLAEVRPDVVALLPPMRPAGAGG